MCVRVLVTETLMQLCLYFVNKLTCLCLYFLLLLDCIPVKRLEQVPSVHQGVFLSDTAQALQVLWILWC